MSIAQQVLANPGKYSIQQLQQGVKNGIIPAYIAVPLIQEKVNQQKQMQMAQAMQQPPAQERPPVAQQVMEEARGLDALPTNLPTQYAGGGIVAFDEGGKVPRFQSQGLVQGYETPYDRMNRLNREREAQQAAYFATPEGRAQQIRSDRAGLMAPIAAAGDVFVGGPANALSYGLSGIANAVGVPRIGRALGIYDPDVTSVELPKVGTGTATPFYDKLRQYAAGQSDSSAPATTAQPTNAPATPAAPTTGEPQGIASVAPQTRLDNSGLGLGGASALGRGPGLGIKQPKFAAPEGGSYKSEAESFYNKYGTEAAALDEKTDKAIKEANESVKGKAFDEYKKSLEQEAVQAGADKEQAKYMSLFKAGLAMMAGTSRHAFENIGKGAMVGTEDYQAAVKDLKKAERERRKEFALIEQARRAEDIGDRDKAVASLEKARERQDTRMRYIGEGIYKGTTLDKSQAYDIAKTQFASESDIFRTHLAGQYQVGAAGVSANARLAAILAAQGGRGQMNQKQVGDVLRELQTSPEAMEHKKKLLKQFGEKSANTPEFQEAMDKFVGGLFQKYYPGANAAGTNFSGGARMTPALQQMLADPSIAQYLNTQP